MVLKQALGSVCLCIIVACAETAFGVPANREVLTFRQPDGTIFRAALYGDEFYSYYQTPEGEIILQDRDNGVWFYARPRANGSLQKTAVPVGQNQITIAALNSERPQWRDAVRKIVEDRALRAYGSSDPTRRPSPSGTVKGVLLLANFSDTSTMFTRTDFDGLLNTTGYQLNGAAGSVNDYYLEASYGQLSLQFGVHGWVRLPQPLAYYGKDDPNAGGPKDLERRQFIEEAIQAADPTVNFADYDDDGDGWVELLGVVHQGQGQEQTGASADCIYSHQGTLDQPVEVDGVRIQDYVVVPEKYYEKLITIGTFCHEIGHRFRLPDLYDLDSSSKGVGYWSLMGTGNWLGPQGRQGAKPCHFDPWCKYMLGWLTPEILSAQRRSIPLPAFDAAEAKVLLIPVDPYQDGEYFLVANRHKRKGSSAATGFEEYLPGSGALILHVDEYVASNNNEGRKKVDVEETDGAEHLDKKDANYGDSGDVFSTPQAAFTDASTPNSRDNEGTGTGIAVRNFGGAGTDLMTCDASPLASLKGFPLFYDWLGGRRALGYGDSGAGYACVRFQTDQAGILERVKTCFNYGGTTEYTVNVYGGWAGTGPTGFITSQSGSHTGVGYEEIVLAAPVTLKLGRISKMAEFVVEIRYDTKGGALYPLPLVDDGDCSGRTYVHAWNTAQYSQLTPSGQYPWDALIRADLRLVGAPAPQPPVLPTDLVEVADAQYAPLTGLAAGSQTAQDQQKQAVQQLKLPFEVKTKQTGIIFRLVPAGQFTMGSPSSEASRWSDEGPQHQVTLTQAFYCGKFEVTQGQWQQVMGSNPSEFKVAGLNAPVEQVSWDDCQVFVKKLCQMEGAAEGTYRLLSEAEWEYACRAGTQTPFCYGNDLDSTMANFDGRFPYGTGQSGACRATTNPVGSFRPNAWGLYDMHGNVWEWCRDWYDSGYYSVGPGSDPLGPAAGDGRVIRGGSWSSRGGSCRSAPRLWYAPWNCLDFLSLRIMRTIPSYP